MPDICICCWIGAPTVDTLRKYTNTRGAASHLSCSESYLEKARVVGDGPRYVKVGRAVRYRIDDLDAWAEARAFGSTSEYVAA